MADVDEVLADGAMARPCLVRSRIADGDLFPFQNLGAAAPVEMEDMGLSSSLEMRLRKLL
jgi:hypothetical protein